MCGTLGVFVPEIRNRDLEVVRSRGDRSLNSTKLPVEAWLLPRCGRRREVGDDGWEARSPPLSSAMRVLAGLGLVGQCTGFG
jgi:hypothetical protein